MKKKINCRKNPVFYQYGYHTTDERRLKLIEKERKLKGLRSKHEYELNKPIYFLTRENIEFLTKDMQIFVKNRSFLLKVDVSEYNQYPDFGSLRDLGLNILENDFGKWIGMFVRGATIPKHLKKWVKVFNNQIPLKEFFTNPYLIKDCIATTHTFVILQDVPLDKILEIKQINFYKT